MKLNLIIDYLKKEYPPSYAMNWDNPGLQVGRMDHGVKKIYVALDATKEVLQHCFEWGADLLVTHHPLIMSGVKQVNSEDFLGEKILYMIEHGIAHYAMHTNYDVIQMTRLAQEKMGIEEADILEITGMLEDGRMCGIGCVGELKTAMTARECCEQVKQAFDLSDVRLFGDPDAMVQRAALSPGSGKSMVGVALASGADILITGDIGHHDGIDAVDQKLLIMDAGHYGIEHIFIHQMAEQLKKEFPELDILEAKKHAPFLTI